VLAPAEYVNITVALSLFTQISAFLSSILAITIGLSKDEHSEHANEKLGLLQTFLFKLFLVLAVIFFMFSPIIMARLNTPLLFAVPIAFMMLFSVPIVVISGYLNGKNQMTKLGLVTLISASSQFVTGLTTALLSHSGLITMLSMIAAQIVTLVIIYSVFSKDHLPGIINPLRTPIGALRDKKMGALITYAAVTSIAIMAISLVQIADLFIMQNLAYTDVKFYTNIYVISRIVFFAGMIFVWPFLGEISVDHHHFNRKPFAKVIGYFSVITLAAIAFLCLFGDKLTHILFGVDYDLGLIREIGALAILYRFLLLVITSVVLYFVVLRSYMAILISAIVSGIVLVFFETVGRGSDMLNVLIWLNIIAGFLSVFSVILLLHRPIRKQSDKR
jgi:O-antigen/teichoic acid export membrane protein